MSCLLPICEHLSKVMIKFYNCHFQGHFLVFVSFVNRWRLQNLMSNIKLWFFLNPKIRTLSFGFYVTKSHSEADTNMFDHLSVADHHPIWHPVKVKCSPQDVFEFGITTPSSWLKREEAFFESGIFFFFARNRTSCSHASAGPASQTSPVIWLKTSIIFSCLSWSGSRGQ